MRYSKIANSFYPEEFQYASLPADIITITAQQHIDAVAVMNAGGKLDVVSGAFTITPMPAPSPDALLVIEKAQAKVRILAQCDNAIVGGFISNALGGAYTYPSKVVDQNNLAANVLSSMYPNLATTWTTPQLCADTNGVWAYKAHSVQAIQQVGTDGKSAIMACLIKNATLQAQITAASTLAALNAIIWSK